MKGKLFFAALAALLLSGPAAAQVHGPTGACWQVSVPAVTARFSGFSLTPSPTGKGIYLQNMQLGSAINTIGGRITSAAVLDQDLIVHSPTFVFGSGALTTVVREGTAATGGLEGDFITQAVNVFNSASIFIPPGKVVTFLHTTANTIATGMICFVEVL